MGQRTRFDLIETIAVTDVFATDLGKIERVSDTCNRFYFCTKQDGELHVVAKLIIPNDCFARMITTRQLMLAELGVDGGDEAADYRLAQ